MVNPLLIYSPLKSPKLEYVLQFASTNFFACDYQIIDNREEFLQAKNEIKLNYSSASIKGILNIAYSDYFSEFDITRNPTFSRDFHFSSDNSNFDVFAAIFFLLSRVEEYRPFEEDSHGRFTSANSILRRLNLLSFPIVDEWLQSLKSNIELTYKVSLAGSSGYKFISTIDVDHIYAYKSKPILVRLGSVLKDIFRLQLDRVVDRFRNFDPYDTYDFIIQAHKELGIHVHSFILTSSKSKFDRSLSPSHKEFVRNIKKLAEHSTIGLHPSYQSESNTERVNIEKRQLENALDRAIISSRQHFVRLVFPKTYNYLIQAGINEDFSMGYPDQSGFRAGTCTPFYWYDLEKDRSTTLKVFPFQLMDVTLKNYLGKNADQAFKEAKEIIDAIRAVNGTAVLIWHNSSFYKNEGWEGWKELYLRILHYAK